MSSSPESIGAACASTRRRRTAVTPSWRHVASTGEPTSPTVEREPLALLSWRCPFADERLCEEK
jgi:hypothetical protein